MNKKSLTFIGYMSLFMSVSLFISIFVVPYLILNDIIGGLQSNYQLKQGNENLWTQIPGSKQVTYQKVLKFLNDRFSTPFATIGGADLESSQTVSYTKSNNFVGPYYNSDGTMNASMTESYALTTDSSQIDLTTRQVRQFRPAVLRAVGEIERRAPT